MVKDMSQGKPRRVLITFAIPILIGGILQQLSNVINAMVIGQNVGVHELGAIGATQATIFLFQSVVIGLVTGITVVISQYFGAKETVQTKKSIYTGLIIVMCMSLFVCLLGILFSRQLLYLINTPNEIIDHALIYIRTMLIGGVPIGLFFGYSSIVRSFGDSITPLIFSSITAITDLILSLIFVIVFHLSVFGSALATVIAFVIGTLSIFLYCNRKSEILRINIKDFKLSQPIAKKMLRLGLPAAIQFTIFSMGNMIIQGVINNFGYSVVTGYVAAISICMLVYQPAFAMGSAISTFSGQNMGANQIQRIKQGLLAALQIITIVNVSLGALVYIFGPQLLNLFIDSSNEYIHSIGVGYLRTVSIFYLLIGFMFCLRETLRGVGDVLSPMAMGILDIVIRVSAAIILGSIFSYHGVWFAQPISWFISTSLGVIVYTRGKWQNKSVVKKDLA